MVKNIIICLFLIAAGIAIYFLFFQNNDEKIIKKQMLTLAELTSKSTNEKTTAAIIKNQSLQKIFAPQCELRFGINMFDGVFSSLQLANSISQANMYLQSSKIQASDITVMLIDANNAEVDFTGEFRGRSKGGDYIEEIRALSAKLEKLDGKWVIKSISIQQVLEK